MCHSLTAMRFRNFVAAVILIFIGIPLASADGPGDSVVVVYNSKQPDSKGVAEHYAERRHVPKSQIIGLDLPTDETMSRADYRTKLQQPLLKFLEDNHLFTYAPAPDGDTPSNAVPIAATVRYAVLCYGVPLRIGEDGTLAEAGADTVAEPLRRNGAAVDSELCRLPVKNSTALLTGPEMNHLFGKVRPEWLSPTNTLLMVTRLDGPSAIIARGLIDKAIAAESNGLWGRAYFDLRGLKDGNYKPGDDMLRAAAEIARECGFDTLVDENEETFPAAFPMSQIALYAGWYNSDANGPFARPKVEFMPGAFAYHLHSYSAQTLRSTNTHWCGPLLAEGAAATMGCVDEPYLSGTPNMDIFFAAWLRGSFTYGEAAYACQRVLSWQTTVIGDPLYRAFSMPPRARHDMLERQHSPWLEWADLQFVNEALILGAKPAEMIDYLTSPSVPSHSPILSEKLAELYHARGSSDDVIKSLEAALADNPSPQQRVRLTLKLHDRFIGANRESDALALLENFTKQNPDYPDLLSLYRRMEALATKLHHSKEAKAIADEIAKRTEHN